MCHVKCLHGLTRNWIYRRGSSFAWNGNVVRLPQDVDIPGTLHLLRFIGIIALSKLYMGAGFLSLTFEILDFKTAVTLKTGLGVRQGHWKCHHAIERI